MGGLSPSLAWLPAFTRLPGTPRLALFAALALSLRSLRTWTTTAATVVATASVPVTFAPGSLLGLPGNRGLIVETIRLFPQNATTDEALQRTQGRLIVRGDETDGIANSLSTARATDAVHVVL